MISKVRLESRESVWGFAVMGNNAATQEKEFVADWHLRFSHCSICGKGYNHHVNVKDARPVLPGDGHMPTLYILPGGDLSPRGAFGFRARNLPPQHLRHPHFYHKGQVDLVFLVLSGEVLEIPTTRYTNPELWQGMSYWSTDHAGRPVYNGCIGLEENFSSRAWLAKDCVFGDLPEYERIETRHTRCYNEKMTTRFTVGCQEIEVDRAGSEIRTRNGLRHHVMTDWCQWRGDTKDFDHAGMALPISIDTLDTYYHQLLDGFDRAGVLFYAECTPEDEDGEGYKFTGRVAFQWKQGAQDVA